jgi:hypothetical protein
VQTNTDGAKLLVKGLQSAKNRYWWYEEERYLDWEFDSSNNKQIDTPKTLLHSPGPPQFSGTPHTSCVGFRYSFKFTALICCR